MTPHHLFVIAATGVAVLAALGVALIAFKLPIEPTRTTERAPD